MIQIAGGSVSTRERSTQQFMATNTPTGFWADCLTASLSAPHNGASRYCGYLVSGYTIHCPHGHSLCIRRLGVLTIVMDRGTALVLDTRVDHHVEARKICKSQVVASAGIREAGRSHTQRAPNHCCRFYPHSFRRSCRSILVQLACWCAMQRSSNSADRKLQCHHANLRDRLKQSS